MLPWNPRILVCGGRNYRNKELVEKVLDRLFTSDYQGVMMLIEGGANGADRLAQDWAISRKCKYHTEPADWDKYHDAAGGIRNEKMARMLPDLCIAFPGGSGTEDMVKRCFAHKIKTIRIRG